MNHISQLLSFLDDYQFERANDYLVRFEYNYDFLSFDYNTFLKILENKDHLKFNRSFLTLFFLSNNFIYPCKESLVELISPYLINELIRIKNLNLNYYYRINPDLNSSDQFEVILFRLGDLRKKVLTSITRKIMLDHLIHLTPNKFLWENLCLTTVLEIYSTVINDYLKSEYKHSISQYIKTPSFGRSEIRTQIDDNMRWYKVINSEGNRGYIYKIGERNDLGYDIYGKKEKFNDDPTQHCGKRRLYFADKHNIHKYLGIGDILVEIEIPSPSSDEDEKVQTIHFSDKSAASSIFVKARKIEEVVREVVNQNNVDYFILWCEKWRYNDLAKELKAKYKIFNF